MIASAAMDAPHPATHEIFVSYSRQDADWAGAFVDSLKKRRWSVFLDTRTIKAGDEWSEEIDAAIDAAKVVIALWSKRSVRSSYVIAEVARAVVRGTLVPLSIDRTDAPAAFRRFQAQPMHVVGATKLPPDLVSTIETRIAAVAPPASPNADEQRLRDELARTAALARDRGVPLLALQGLLERLGEVDVAPEAAPARLEKFVAEFLKLRADLAHPTIADPDVATTQSRALALLNSGDLDGARTLIDDALTRRRALYQQSARETAALLADRARIDVMKVRYREAIAAYEEASSLVSFDARAMLQYLDGAARALMQQGDDFDSDEALARAVEMIRTRMLPLTSRDQSPLDWAHCQDRLGSVLRMRGASERIAHCLHEAVTASRAALEVYVRDRYPLGWAAAQNNLGNALRDLGALEKAAAHFEQAVEAFEAALEVFTRDRYPLDWALAQNNIGLTLAARGFCEGRTALLEQAAAAFEAALEERTRDRGSWEWAVSKVNWANCLEYLGEHESGTERLEKSVAAYHAVLEVFTRARTPVEWAKTQHNMGEALLALGKRGAQIVRLEEAEKAFSAALEERTRDRAPRQWAETQKKLNQTRALIVKRLFE